MKGGGRMGKMDKKVLFETTITDFELMNSEFTKATINIFHKGENRNGSFITEEAMHKMGKTLLGVPVIGEFLQDKNQIGGHGGKLVITDDGFEMIETTECMGFVDPRTEPFFRDYTETDGVTVNTYMCANVILWTGRFGFLQRELEKGLKQSMEIGVKHGEFDSNTGYYVIKDAYFQALCLLGEGVEPCFSASSVQLNYSNKESDETYKEMIDAFKKYTVKELGGETMPEAEAIQEVQEVQEVEAPEVVEETVEETVEGTIEVVENEEVVVEEAIEESTEEPVAVEEGAEFEAPEAEESATEEVVEEVAEETVEDEEEVVVTEDSEPEVDYQARIEELEMALAEATRELEAVKAENARLAEFEATVKAEQRKGQEEALFAQFASLEGFEGYAELVENAKQYSIEDLETKLFALLGKKNFSMTNKPKKQGSAKLPVGTPTTEARTYYGGRFDKYLK